jgi:hypothetical protein
MTKQGFCAGKTAVLGDKFPNVRLATRHVVQNVKKYLKNW